MKKMLVTGLRAAFAASLISGCASQPMKPAEVGAMSSQELCIDAARMYITGRQIAINGHPVDPNDVVQTLHGRGEQCEPKDEYMKIAYERTQLEQQDAIAKAQQSQAMTSALLGASQVFQQQQMIQQQQTTNSILQQQNNILQQQTLPTTTHCSTDGSGNTTCRSY